MIILLTLIIILFVCNSQLVLSGSLLGLSIWFNDIVPILLPFIIISNIFMQYFNKHIPSAFSIISTIFIGTLCGFPIGAKITCDMVNSDNYSYKIGQILLPLCNNFSPMFISGYISVILLNNTYSLSLIFLLIYIPYIIVFLLFYCFFKIISYKNILHKNENTNKNNKSYSASDNKPNDIIIKAINQITIIGVYIMIFCILMKFIQNISFISVNTSSIICSLLEYSSGIKELLKTNISSKFKTALIIALASFGGLSSIFQTISVIQQSRLSIIKYIFVKLLCASATFYLTILVI